jgi:hypothetical protein
MVMVAIMADVVVLVAVKPGVLVVPLATKPIAVLELVHVKVAPVGVLINPFEGTAAPAQYVRLGSASTVGNGFTVTITASVEAQPVEVFVVVNV